MHVTYLGYEQASEFDADLHTKEILSPESHNNNKEKNRKRSFWFFPVKQEKQANSAKLNWDKSDRTVSGTLNFYIWVLRAPRTTK